MIIGTKIKLNPTKEQEILFRKSAGVARWSYNYFLGESNNYYNENKKSLKEGEVRKYINNVLKKTTHTWLKEVGSNVMKQGVKDANLARERWFKGLANKPKFKSRRKSKYQRLLQNKIYMNLKDKFNINAKNMEYSSWKQINGIHHQKLAVIVDLSKRI